jgi:PleD family two-component response regulator
MSLHIAAHKFQIGVTVSIGIAEAGDGTSGIEAWMGAADHVLYQANAEGRNRSTA